MLPQNAVDEVLRLLALGTLSRKKIAAVTRVSRGSVSAIASGKRSIKSRYRAPRAEESLDADGENRGFRYPTGPWKRCPNCGGIVRTPCLACQLLRDERKETSPNACNDLSSGVK